MLVYQTGGLMLLMAAVGGVYGVVAKLAGTPAPGTGELGPSGIIGLALVCYGMMGMVALVHIRLVFGHQGEPGLREQRRTSYIMAATGIPALAAGTMLMS